MGGEEWMVERASRLSNLKVQMGAVKSKEVKREGWVTLYSLLFISGLDPIGNNYVIIQPQCLGC